jgi:hypothetical protein
MNMRLSEKAIKELKEIYQKEFGENITDNEACEKFLRLVNLLRAILKQPSIKGQRSSSPSPLLVDEHCKNAKLKE